MQKNSTSADELAKDLSQFIPVTQIFRDEPMAQHCTFRTGGNADLFIRVNRTEELRSALSVLRQAGPGSHCHNGSGNREGQRVLAD